jgi:hypothetical protein
MLLTYNREVKSDFPDEASGNSQRIMNMKVSNKPLTVTIPADLKTLSGTEQVKAEGQEAEGGTVTIKWTLTFN